MHIPHILASQGICVYVFISGVQHRLTVQRIILTHFSPSGSHQSLFSLYWACSDHLLHSGSLPWQYWTTSHRYNAAGHRPCKKALDLTMSRAADKLQPDTWQSELKWSGTLITKTGVITENHNSRPPPKHQELGSARLQTSNHVFLSQTGKSLRGDLFLPNVM